LLKTHSAVKPEILVKKEIFIGYREIAFCPSGTFMEPPVLYTATYKKQDINLLSISSPNIDRFSKFFHCYKTKQEI